MVYKKIERSVFVANYPESVKTLGDHIRKRRLDLMMEQKEVAEILGTNKCTIANWEHNRFEPAIAFMPKILDFLEYLPYDLFKASSFSEIIRVFRRTHGISQRELAKQLGVDPSSIYYWENETHAISGEMRQRLREFIKNNSNCSY